MPFVTPNDMARAYVRELFGTKQSQMIDRSSRSGGPAGHFDERGLDDAAEGAQDGIDVVRVAYPDLIGIERGRDVLVDRFARSGRATASRSAGRSTAPARWAT